jgi:hypothetical protein
MATIKQGLNAADRENAFLGRQIRAHQRRFRDAIRKLENRILLLLDETLVRKDGRLVNTKVKLKQAQKLHRKLLLLFEQEYGAASVSVVKGFDAVSKAIERRYQAFDDAYKFTDVSKEVVDGLKTAALRDFQAFGAMAREQVAGALYEAVLVGGQYAVLTRSIRSILTGRYSKTGRPMTTYTDQMAFDQTMSFHNSLNISEADRAGIEHFLYYGNTQTNTRRFCRARVGSVYSRKEIDSWTHDWDGKSGPAMTNRGGYNCRHSWVPVEPKWFDGKQQEIRKEARAG